LNLSSEKPVYSSLCFFKRNLQRYTALFPGEDGSGGLGVGLCTLNPFDP
jgi:hypothetical protein